MSIIVDLISADHPAKPPAWLVSQLELWIEHRSAGSAGHAFIVTSEDINEASLFCHLLASQQFCTETSDAAVCGQCRSCRAFLQGVHGDFVVVRRSEGKVSIGIDQIRQVIQALHQTPLYGSIKVVLIEAADQMSLAAANSLLKILEEPPGNALVLLATAAIWQVPPTVRSRCQRLSLSLPTARQAQHWLEAEQGMDPATTRQALQLSQGKAILALTLNEEGSLSIRQALVQSFEESSQNAGPPAIWSKVSASVLIENLLVWVERQSRMAFQSDKPVGKDWLRLHSCLGELYDRVKRGATPAQDILVAEVYRLYRSCGHKSFETICGRFLAGLGRVDPTG